MSSVQSNSAKLNLQMELAVHILAGSFLVELQRLQQTHSQDRAGLCTGITEVLGS